MKCAKKKSLHVIVQKYIYTVYIKNIKLEYIIVDLFIHVIV